MSIGPITFAVATNDRAMLERNLLASPLFAGDHPHQLLVQEGYSSAPAAYNDAIERSANDVMVFVHQDIYLPDEWLSGLESAIERLETVDPNWGVLGCSGQTDQNENRGYVYSHGLGIVGRAFQRPEIVQTLDEIVLIVRKSSGLRFDGAIPHFHMYGADLCLSAARNGMRNYAIPAFCIHNTEWMPVLPKEFYVCYREMKRKWADSLPIFTTCVRITRFDSDIVIRKVRRAVRRWIRGELTANPRMQDIEALVETAFKARRRVESCVRQLT